MLMVVAVFISMMLLPGWFRKKVSVRDRDHRDTIPSIGTLIIFTSPFLISFTSIWFWDAMDPTGNFGAYLLVFYIGWFVIIGAEHIAEGSRRLLRIS